MKFLLKHLNNVINKTKMKQKISYIKVNYVYETKFSKISNKFNDYCSTIPQSLNKQFYLLILKSLATYMGFPLIS